MSERIAEVLDRIEARQQCDLSAIDGADGLSFLQAIYRDRQAPLSVRMRAAIEALPFEAPKLSATAVLTGDDFAARLERAIDRSGIKLIEHKPVEPPKPESPSGKFGFMTRALWQAA